jgi:LysM repeat protein
MKLTALAGIAVVAAITFAGSPTAHAQTNKKVKQASKQEVTVVINEGDTLSHIAQDHQTTYQRLYDANTQINDPDLIYPGDKVRVPNVDEQLAHRDLPAKALAEIAATPAPAAPQSAAQQKSTYTAPVTAAPAVQAAPVSGCGDNSYANYIYSHESGCRTTASSPNGCYGIGQACPASKIAYCGADYACQNAYFTSYANKYGGWAGAYDFWVSHGWW